ncbi:MAG: LytTR family DNA-binding domain-containing protein [Prolixibacteraceae bacterium]
MIRTIAIDDEPLALKLVADYIKKTPFLEFVAKFDNPLDAVDFLGGDRVDLIILDIQMPDLTGIEFTKTLQDDTKIIFTTAFEKYAIDGFRLNAVDYLLKPFSYQEFLTAVSKARKLIDLEHAALPTIEVSNEFLFVKSEYKIRRINFQDILYVEGLKDYIKVYLDNEPKPILSLNSMKSIEQKLPDDRFMRVHRSFIVNLSRVNMIERGRIIFGKVYIPVSDNYKDKFQEFVDRNFI